MSFFGTGCSQASQILQDTNVFWDASYPLRSFHPLKTLHAYPDTENAKHLGQQGFYSWFSVTYLETGRCFCCFKIFDSGHSVIKARKVLKRGNVKNLWTPAWDCPCPESKTVNSGCPWGRKGMGYFQTIVHITWWYHWNFVASMGEIVE